MIFLLVFFLHFLTFSWGRLLTDRSTSLLSALSSPLPNDNEGPPGSEEVLLSENEEVSILKGKEKEFERLLEIVKSNAAKETCPEEKQTFLCAAVFTFSGANTLVIDNAQHLQQYCCSTERGSEHGCDALCKKKAEIGGFEGDETCTSDCEEIQTYIFTEDVSGTQEPITFVTTEKEKEEEDRQVDSNLRPPIDANVKGLESMVNMQKYLRKCISDFTDARLEVASAFGRADREVTELLKQGLDKEAEKRGRESVKTAYKTAERIRRRLTACKNEGVKMGNPELDDVIKEEDKLASSWQGSELFETATTGCNFLDGSHKIEQYQLVSDDSSVHVKSCYHQRKTLRKQAFFGIREDLKRILLLIQDANREEDVYRQLAVTKGVLYKYPKWMGEYCSDSAFETKEECEKEIHLLESGNPYERNLHSVLLDENCDLPSCMLLSDVDVKIVMKRKPEERSLLDEKKSARAQISSILQSIIKLTETQKEELRHSLENSGALGNITVSSFIEIDSSSLSRGKLSLIQKYLHLDSSELQKVKDDVIHRYIEVHLSERHGRPFDNEETVFLELNQEGPENHSEEDVARSMVSETAEMNTQTYKSMKYAEAYAEKNHAENQKTYEGILEECKDAAEFELGVPPPSQEVSDGFIKAMIFGSSGADTPLDKLIQEDQALQYKVDQQCGFNSECAFPNLCRNDWGGGPGLLIKELGHAIGNTQMEIPRCRPSLTNVRADEQAAFRGLTGGGYPSFECRSHQECDSGYCDAYQVHCPDDPRQCESAPCKENSDCLSGRCEDDTRAKTDNTGEAIINDDGDDDEAIPTVSSADLFRFKHAIKPHTKMALSKHKSELETFCSKSIDKVNCKEKTCTTFWQFISPKIAISDITKMLSEGMERFCKSGRKDAEQQKLCENAKTFGIDFSCQKKNSGSKRVCDRKFTKCKADKKVIRSITSKKWENASTDRTVVSTSASSSASENDSTNHTVESTSASGSANALSSVQLTSKEPFDGEEGIEANQPIILRFSAPVKMQDNKFITISPNDKSVQSDVKIPISEACKFTKMDPNLYEVECKVTGQLSGREEWSVTIDKEAFIPKQVYEFLDRESFSQYCHSHGENLSKFCEEMNPMKDEFVCLKQPEMRICESSTFKCSSKSFSDLFGDNKENDNRKDTFDDISNFCKSFKRGDQCKSKTCNDYLEEKVVLLDENRERKAIEMPSWTYKTGASKDMIQKLTQSYSNESCGKSERSDFGVICEDKNTILFQYEQAMIETRSKNNDFPTLLNPLLNGNDRDRLEDIFHKKQFQKHTCLVKNPKYMQDKKMFDIKEIEIDCPSELENEINVHIVYNGKSTEDPLSNWTKKPDDGQNIRTRATAISIPFTRGVFDFKCQLQYKKNSAAETRHMKKLKLVKDEASKFIELSKWVQTVALSEKKPLIIPRTEKQYEIYQGCKKDIKVFDIPKGNEFLYESFWNLYENNLRSLKRQHLFCEEVMDLDIDDDDVKQTKKFSPICVNISGESKEEFNDNCEFSKFEKSCWKQENDEKCERQNSIGFYTGQQVMYLKKGRSKNDDSAAMENFKTGVITELSDDGYSKIHFKVVVNVPSACQSNPDGEEEKQVTIIVPCDSNELSIGKNAENLCEWENSKPYEKVRVRQKGSLSSDDYIIQDLLLNDEQKQSCRNYLKLDFEVKQVIVPKQHNHLGTYKVTVARKKSDGSKNLKHETVDWFRIIPIGKSISARRYKIPASKTVEYFLHPDTSSENSSQGKLKDTNIIADIVICGWIKTMDNRWIPFDEVRQRKEVMMHIPPNTCSPQNPCGNNLIYQLTNNTTYSIIAVGRIKKSSNTEIVIDTLEGIFRKINNTKIIIVDSDNPTQVKGTCNGEDNKSRDECGLQNEWIPSGGFDFNLKKDDIYQAIPATHGKNVLYLSDFGLCKSMFTPKLISRRGETNIFKEGAGFLYAKVVDRSRTSKSCAPYGPGFGLPSQHIMKDWKNQRVDPKKIKEYKVLRKRNEQSKEILNWEETLNDIKYKDMLMNPNWTNNPKQLMKDLKTGHPLFPFAGSSKKMNGWNSIESSGNCMLNRCEKGSDCLSGLCSTDAVNDSTGRFFMDDDEARLRGFQETRDFYLQNSADETNIGVCIDSSVRDTTLSPCLKLMSGGFPKLGKKSENVEESESDVDLVERQVVRTCQIYCCGLDNDDDDGKEIAEEKDKRCKGYRSASEENKEFCLKLEKEVKEESKVMEEDKLDDDSKGFLFLERGQTSAQVAARARVTERMKAKQLQTRRIGLSAAVSAAAHLRAQGHPLSDMAKKFRKSLRDGDNFLSGFGDWIGNNDPQAKLTKSLLEREQTANRYAREFAMFISDCSTRQVAKGKLRLYVDGDTDALLVVGTEYLVPLNGFKHVDPRGYGIYAFYENAEAVIDSFQIRFPMDKMRTEWMDMKEKESLGGPSKLGFNVAPRVMNSDENRRQKNRALLRNFHNVLRSYVKFDTLTLLTGQSMGANGIAKNIVKAGVAIANAIEKAGKWYGKKVQELVSLLSISKIEKEQGEGTPCESNDDCDSSLHLECSFESPSDFIDTDEEDEVKSKEGEQFLEMKSKVKSNKYAIWEKRKMNKHEIRFQAQYHSLRKLKRMKKSTSDDTSKNTFDEAVSQLDNTTNSSTASKDNKRKNGFCRRISGELKINDRCFSENPKTKPEYRCADDLVCKPSPDEIEDFDKNSGSRDRKNSPCTCQKKPITDRTGESATEKLFQDAMKNLEDKTEAEDDVCLIPPRESDWEECKGAIGKPKQIRCYMKAIGKKAFGSLLKVLFKSITFVWRQLAKLLTYTMRIGQCLLTSVVVCSRAFARWNASNIQSGVTTLSQDTVMRRLTETLGAAAGAVQRITKSLHHTGKEVAGATVSGFVSVLVDKFGNRFGRFLQAILEQFGNALRILSQAFILVGIFNPVGLMTAFVTGVVVEAVDTVVGRDDYSSGPVLKQGWLYVIERGTPFKAGWRKTFVVARSWAITAYEKISDIALGVEDQFITNGSIGWIIQRNENLGRFQRNNHLQKLVGRLNAFGEGKLASHGQKAYCESGKDCESGDCNNGLCVSKPCFKNIDCESNKCSYLTDLPANCEPTPLELALGQLWEKGDGRLIEAFLPHLTYFTKRPYEGFPDGTDGPGSICMKFGVCPHIGIHLDATKFPKRTGCPNEGNWKFRSKKRCASQTSPNEMRYEVRCCVYENENASSMDNDDRKLERMKKSDKHFRAKSDKECSEQLLCRNGCAMEDSKCISSKEIVQISSKEIVGDAKASLDLLIQDEEIDIASPAYQICNVRDGQTSPTNAPCFCTEIPFPGKKAPALCVESASRYSSPFLHPSCTATVPVGWIVCPRSDGERCNYQCVRQAINDEHVNFDEMTRTIPVTEILQDAATISERPKCIVPRELICERNSACKGNQNKCTNAACDPELGLTGHCQWIQKDPVSYTSEFKCQPKSCKKESDCRPRPRLTCQDDDDSDCYEGGSRAQCETLEDMSDIPIHVKVLMKSSFNSHAPNFDSFMKRQVKLKKVKDVKRCFQNFGYCSESHLSSSQFVHRKMCTSDEDCLSQRCNIRGEATFPTKKRKKSASTILNEQQNAGKKMKPATFERMALDPTHRDCQERLTSGDSCKFGPKADVKCHSGERVPDTFCLEDKDCENITIVAKFEKRKESMTVAIDALRAYANSRGSEDVSADEKIFQEDVLSKYEYAKENGVICPKDKEKLDEAYQMFYENNGSTEKEKIDMSILKIGGSNNGVENILSVDACIARGAIQCESSKDCVPHVPKWVDPPLTCQNVNIYRCDRFTSERLCNNTGNDCKWEEASKTCSGEREEKVKLCVQEKVTSTGGCSTTAFSMTDKECDEDASCDKDYCIRRESDKKCIAKERELKGQCLLGVTDDARKIVSTSSGLPDICVKAHKCVLTTVNGEDMCLSRKHLAEPGDIFAAAMTEREHRYHRLETVIEGLSKYVSSDDMNWRQEVNIPLVLTNTGCRERYYRTGKCAGPDDDNFLIENFAPECTLFKQRTNGIPICCSTHPDELKSCFNEICEENGVGTDNKCEQRVIIPKARCQKSIECVKGVKSILYVARPNLPTDRRMQDVENSLLAEIKNESESTGKEQGKVEKAAETLISEINEHRGVILECKTNEDCREFLNLPDIVPDISCTEMSVKGERKHVCVQTIKSSGGCSKPVRGHGARYCMLGPLDDPQQYAYFNGTSKGLCTGDSIDKFASGTCGWKFQEKKKKHSSSFKCRHLESVDTKNHWFTHNECKNLHNEAKDMCKDKESFFARKQYICDELETNQSHVTQCPSPFALQRNLEETKFDLPKMKMCGGFKNVVGEKHSEVLCCSNAPNPDTRQLCGKLVASNHKKLKVSTNGDLPSLEKNYTLASPKYVYLDTDDEEIDKEGRDILVTGIDEVKVNGIDQCIEECDMNHKCLLFEMKKDESKSEVEADYFLCILYGKFNDKATVSLASASLLYIRLDRVCLEKRNRVQPYIDKFYEKYRILKKMNSLCDHCNTDISCRKGESPQDVDREFTKTYELHSLNLSIHNGGVNFNNVEMIDYKDSTNNSIDTVTCLKDLHDEHRKIGLKRLKKKMLLKVSWRTQKSMNPTPVMSFLEIRNEISKNKFLFDFDIATEDVNDGVKFDLDKDGVLSFEEVTQSFEAVEMTLGSMLLGADAQGMPVSFTQAFGSMLTGDIFASLGEGVATAAVQDILLKHGEIGAQLFRSTGLESKGVYTKAAEFKKIEGSDEGAWVDSETNKPLTDEHGAPLVSIPSGYYVLPASATEGADFTKAFSKKNIEKEGGNKSFEEKIRKQFNAWLSRESDGKLFGRISFSEMTKALNLWCKDETERESDVPPRYYCEEEKETKEFCCSSEQVKLEEKRDCFCIAQKNNAELSPEISKIVKENDTNGDNLLSVVEISNVMGKMGIAHGLDWSMIMKAFLIAANYWEKLRVLHSQFSGSFHKTEYVSKDPISKFGVQSIGHAARGYCLPKFCDSYRIIGTLDVAEECLRKDQLEERKKNFLNYSDFTNALETPTCIKAGIFSEMFSYDDPGKRGNLRKVMKAPGICSEQDYKSIIEIDALGHEFNYWMRPIDRDYPLAKPVYSKKYLHGGPTYTGKNLLKPWFEILSYGSRSAEVSTEVGQGLRATAAMNDQMQMPDAWVSDRADANKREMIRKESVRNMMGPAGARGNRLAETAIGLEFNGLAESARIEQRALKNHNANRKFDG
eukprot:g6323.t1